MSNFFPKLGSAFVLCVALGTLTARAITLTTVSGVVQDSHGSPQVGALVELLRSDSSVIASVYTDGNGRYSISHIQPGVYQVKALGVSFLPSLRRNLRVKTHTVVNLTLSTIFEATQWFPAQRRGADESDDDWKWTLRSSSNRPLLRMLEDGPTVLIAEGGRAAEPVKTRVSSMTSSGQFGKTGVHNTFEVGHSSGDEKQTVLFRGDVSTGPLPSAQMAVGYRHEVANGQVFRTVVAVSDHPQIAGTDAQNRLSTMVVRSSEAIRLTENIEAEAGSELDAVRSNVTRIENHPFGSVQWKSNNNRVHYAFATVRNFRHAEDAAVGDGSVLPQAVEQNGLLSIEHGLHQEIGIGKDFDRGEIDLVLYRDRISDPVVNGGGNLSSDVLNSGDVLYDSANDLFRIAGRDYVSTGVVLSARYRLNGENSITCNLADGNALAFSADGKPMSLAQAMKQLRPVRAQMLAVALNGKISSTGARWRASYRWQPQDTVTAVAAFGGDIAKPYLTLYIRQPLRGRRMLPNGFDAQLEIRNLLSEGSRSFASPDGNTMYFAQAERAIQGGFSFTF